MIQKQIVFVFLASGELKISVLSNIIKLVDYIFEKLFVSIKGGL